MNLLTFAHFQEARPFILHFKCEQDPRFNSLYRTNHLLILITGEGGKNARFSLNKVINLKITEIDLIINLGVCGSLSSKLKIGEALIVASLISEHSQTPISSAQAGVCCITSAEAVENIDYKQALAPLADICDREAWHLGEEANFSNIEFKCMKVVSDLSEKVELKKIKANIPIYGKTLLELYLRESRNF